LIFDLKIAEALAAFVNYFKLELKTIFPSDNAEINSLRYLDGQELILN